MRTYVTTGLQNSQMNLGFGNEAWKGLTFHASAKPIGWMTNLSNHSASGSSALNQVATDGELVFQFDGKVILSNDNTKVIKVYKNSDKSLVESISMTSSHVTVGDNQRSVVVDFLNDFVAGEQYFVHISQGAFSVAGKAYAGIGTDYAYQFEAVDGDAILHKIYQGEKVTVAELSVVVSGVNSYLLSDYQKAIDQATFTDPKKNKQAKAQMVAEVQHLVANHSADLSWFFADTIKFNADIDTLDVSLASTMLAMFYCVYNFNQDIGSWDVGKVNTMSSMFDSAYIFNQDIGNWDVSKVEYINLMFYSARAFNQDIGRWDVSNVNDMSSMFGDAIAFNQNLSNWNISHLTKATNMFKGASAFSTENYDALLVGWSSIKITQGESIHDHVDFGANNTQYTNATARQRLLDYHWKITDAGLDADRNDNGIIDVLVGNNRGTYIDAYNNTEGVMIHGLGGADHINGSCYDDILYGGKAGDVLVGNDGADTFVFNNIKEIDSDTIADFDASEGDIIDFRYLLDGYHDPLINPHQDISHYLSVSQSNGSYILHINPTGNASPALASHNITLLYAQEFDIHSMIVSGNLIL